MANGDFTRSEIASQRDVWQKTLEKFSQQQGELSGALTGLSKRPFIVIGCGSTYYLALHAASVLRSVGVNAWALPSSELVFFPQAHLPGDFILLVLSRSGTTSESLWAMDAYRTAHPSTGKIISISCVPGTPMVAGSDIVLCSEFAQEKSVAQTRSFSSMALMVQALAGMLGDDMSRLERLARLPGALESMLAQIGDLPQRLGGDLGLDRLFFLGSGPFYGIACEMMLKTKEMTTSWAEAYHCLEFRHGPMSVVSSSTLLVGLISDSGAAAEMRVLREMKAKGALTLAFTESRGDYDWSGVDMLIETQTGLSDWERPVLYLPPVQWLAFYRALAKGLDPDSPTNLTQVVELERG